MFFYNEQSIPTDPYTAAVLLLLKGDGINNSTNIIDSSTNNVAIARAGNVKISTTKSKFGDSSLYFDGINDYLFSQTNPVYNFGTSDFTIETWVNLSADNLRYQTLASLAYNNDGSGYVKALQIRYGDAGFGYKLQVTLQSFNAYLVWSCAITQTTHKNKWSHIAFTRSSGVCRLFVDGVVQNINNGANPSTYPHTSFTDNTNIIGNSGFYFGYGFVAGYFDDIRVTKGIARYTTNFIPPGSL